MNSPTQRSLAHLRRAGYPLVQVVERWNPHARIRQDLYGGSLGLEALAALAGANQVERGRHQAPPDRETARAAAVELRARGLTVHDIAAALRLSAGAVRGLLGELSSRPVTSPEK